MRKYLATIHQKSPHHKRRFALLTSGGFTLIIFAFWAAFNLGPSAGSGQTASVNMATPEANPFGTFIRGFGSLFKDGKDELKEGFEMVDLGSGYTDLRDNTLNSYGQ